MGPKAMPWIQILTLLLKGTAMGLWIAYFANCSFSIQV